MCKATQTIAFVQITYSGDTGNCAVQSREEANHLPSDEGLVKFTTMATELFTFSQMWVGLDSE